MSSSCRVQLLKFFLVKFISYNVRRRIYDARRKLRDKPALRHIFINEDLTRENSRLAYEARTLENRGKIAETYTRDGRIFVKRFPTGSPTIVKDLSHLQEIANAPDYNRVAATTARYNASRRGPPNTVMHEDNATGNARAQTPDDDLSQSLLRQPPPELSPQPPLTLR